MASSYVSETSDDEFAMFGVASSAEQCTMNSYFPVHVIYPEFQCVFFMLSILHGIRAEQSNTTSMLRYCFFPGEAEQSRLGQRNLNMCSGTPQQASWPTYSSMYVCRRHRLFELVACWHFGARARLMTVQFSKFLSAPISAGLQGTGTSVYGLFNYADALHVFLSWSLVSCVDVPQVATRLLSL